MKFLKSKIFILSTIALILLISIGVSSKEERKINIFGNVITIPLAPLQKVVSLSGQKVESVVTFFNDIKGTKEENEQLKLKILGLEKERNNLIKYEKENQRLKESLKFKDQFNDFELLGANIIAKDSGNWFNVFTVDVGMNDGVKVKFPVIANSGLVGRVINSNLISSKIIAIIDPDSAVSGRLSNTRDLVIIKGDMQLKNKGLCKMEYIPPEVDVSIGDMVETSGLGGIYPEGILIGKVIEISKTTGDLNRHAIIEPAVDFKRLEEVLVLKNKGESLEEKDKG